MQHFPNELPEKKIDLGDDSLKHKPMEPAEKDTPGDSEDRQPQQSDVPDASVNGD